MYFPTRDITIGSGEEVKAWTPLPNARELPAFNRMVRTGVLVEVPDRLLIESGKPKSKRPRGRPRKELRAK